MKIGLVLEGGAMRGIYTAGVLDVFLEENIFVDGVMGVSAGAIHGCSYVSNQAGRSIRYYLRYCGDKRFMSFHSLITTGSIVNEQFCYHEIPEVLDPFDHVAFETSTVDFYVVCSNLESGKAEYILCPTLQGRQMDYLLASASMPLLSRTVHIGDKQYLDGGVCDSIPVKAMADLGYDKLVVVLTQPDGYEKKPFPMGAANIRYRRYPRFLEALRQRHENYNQSLALVRQMQKDGKAFAIYPSENLHIHRAEKDVGKIKGQYQLGRKDASAVLPQLKAFLAK